MNACDIATYNKFFCVNVSLFNFFSFFHTLLHDLFSHINNVECCLFRFVISIGESLKHFKFCMVLLHSIPRILMALLAFIFIKPFFSNTIIVKSKVQKKELKSVLRYQKKSWKCCRHERIK